MNRLFISFLLLFSVTMAHAWPSTGTIGESKSVRQQEREVRKLTEKLKEAEKEEQRAYNKAVKAVKDGEKGSRRSIEKMDKALLKAEIAHLEANLARSKARAAVLELERLLANPSRNSSTVASAESSSVESSTYYASEVPSFQGPNVEPHSGGLGTHFADTDPSEGQDCRALLNER